MNAYLRLLSCALLLTTTAATARVVVHKCVDAEGRTSFQQQACPPRSKASTLSVEGDIDPAVAAAARERAAQDAPAPKVAATPPPAATAPPAPPPPTPRCPATRENPGRIPVAGTDPWSMAVARSIYNDLPSETTLKNSGRWPRNCVR